MATVDLSTHTIKALAVVVGTPDPATPQGLRSAYGIRIETSDATKTIDLVGTVNATLIKVHNFGTTMGQATMYLKHDGGGGFLQFQRDPGNLIIGGIGGNGAWTGSTTNRDDLAIVADASKIIRFYANGETTQSAQLASGELSVNSNAAEPRYWFTRAGVAAGYFGAPAVNDVRLYSAAGSAKVIFTLSTGAMIVGGLITGNGGFTAAAGTDIQFGQTTIAVGTGAAATLALVGGTGRPATAAQNGWLPIKDSAGTVAWVPLWK